MGFALRVARVAMVLAIVGAGGPAGATIIRTFTSAELVDLAAQSSVVVRARFVRWQRKPDPESGRRPDGSFSVPEMYNNEALARFYVEEVVGGDATLAQKEITLIDRSQGGMESTQSVLLFLRRDGAQFSQVLWGGFAVEGGMVQLQLGPRWEVPWTEVAAMVRKVNLVRLTWRGTVAPTATRGGALHVELAAKNEGTVATQVLAPSYCQCVKAYPLAKDGRWYPRQDNWFEVPSGGLAALDEAPVSLSVGASHVFRYDIPLASMKMDAADSYDIVLGMSQTFCSPPSSEPSAPQRVRGNSMADLVTRVVLNGPHGAGAADAGAGEEAADARSVVGVTSLGSPDAAAPPAVRPARSERGCGGGCATVPSTAGVPLITVAAFLLALALRKKGPRGSVRRG